MKRLKYKRKRYNSTSFSYISGEIPTVKGDKGDPFTYSDFTQEQLDTLKGTDGFSPTATVEKVGKVATITITDINGTTTATITDGAGSGGSGEENKIESISVNGTPILVDENKNVDIEIPSIEGLATETYVENKIANYTKTVDLADVAELKNDLDNLFSSNITGIKLNGSTLEVSFNNGTSIGKVSFEGMVEEETIIS